MESKTFHPFPRLPKELRDMIWALAIRPELPSAHFFTVFNSSYAAEWSALAQYSMRDWHTARCSLAAPRSHPSDDAQQQFSWARGNRSAYLIDSGLWTACTESRDAAERRFKVAEWDRKRWDMLRDGPGIGKNAPDAPATASFKSNGEWQLCLTHPKSDVFLLRPFDAETVAWYSLPFSVPIFNKYMNYSVSHIALDYDPGWLVDGEHLGSDDNWNSLGTIGCVIRAAATSNQAHWAKNLWFVDRRLRRRPGALSTTTNRHQFHGSGCKLTEVRDGDVDWALDNARDTFRFLGELARKVDEYYEYAARSVELAWANPDHAPGFGVLAYEECGF
jgi:hypothetical protein